MKRIVTASLPIAVIAFLLPKIISAQSYTPGIRSPQEEILKGALSKAQARAEYFYNRVTYPSGSIPIGARAKACAFVEKRFPVYNPSHGAQSVPVWRNVGPINIGGRILSIATNPKNSNTMFIGAADGGVWRSYDNGNTWRPVSDDFPVQSMGALVIDPADTNIVYAGTGEANIGLNSFDGAGIFKSTDGGDTWINVGAATLPDYPRVSDLAIDPQNPLTLYAAIPDGIRDTVEGIWKTIDGGATWRKVFNGRPYNVVLDPKHPSILYTASSIVYSGGTSANSGLFKSVDGGGTWTRLDIGIAPESMGRTSIGISASNPDILYIGVSRVSDTEGATLIGVFKTTDAGATWARTSVPFNYFAKQGWFDNFIGVNPVNPDIVFAGGTQLLRSSDGGTTWQHIADQGSGGILHVDQHAIEFDPADPDRVLIGNDGGFFVLTNSGSTTIKRDLGLSITQFVGGGMHPSIDAFLFGGTQDNGVMTSTNAPMWNPVLYGDGGNSIINPLKPNIMYTTMETLKFWRSEDFGQTWTLALGGISPHSSLFYIDYAMDQQNPSTLYLGTYRMYKTTDEGKSWVLLRDCFFPTGQSCYYISAVSVAEYDPRLVFAGATGGLVAVSQDAGQNWTVVRDSLPVSYCSAVRSFEPGVVYATFSRYGVPKVWRSADYGNTWRSITGNLPDIPVFDIIRLDGKLIIASEIGPFISDDEGASWQRFGTGMPTIAIMKLRYNSNTGTLRAVTYGRGMFDMEWKSMTQSAPQYVSKPDTSVLEAGQPFIYAPVVIANPPARFSLAQAPAGSTVDSVLGVVRWNGGEKTARFTLEAANNAGKTQQTFTLTTNDVIAADWQIVRDHAMSTQVYSLRAAAGGTLWISRDSAFVSRSTDGGATWQDSQLPGTKAMVPGLYVLDANTAFAGTRSGQLFKTTDGGGSWRLLLSSANSMFGDIAFWDASNGVALCRVGRDSVDVFKTADAGETWTPATARIFAPSWWLNYYQTLTFFDGQSGWFASPMLDQSTPRDAFVYRTSDGGSTWGVSSAGTSVVSSIAFLTKSKGYLVDPEARRVRRTASGGSSWTTTFYPMNGAHAIAVYCDTLTYSVWIVTDSCAWVSRNEGNSWTRTQMVPVGPIRAAAFLPSGQAWAVSRSGHVQKLMRNPLTSVEAQPGIPSGLRLDAGYPNPVHDAGTIPFHLAAATRVTAIVSNSAGKTIATLVDDVLPAGEHLTTWDATAVGSGVYFVTVSAGEEKATARLVVAR